MSEKHCVSRRASLKCFGAAGAAIVFGTVASAQAPADPRAASGGQDKQSANPADVAVARFAKGHA